MKKEEKYQLKVVIVIVIFLSILISILIWGIADDVNTDRKLKIDGIIVDVEYIGESNQYRYGDLYQITFNTSDVIVVEGGSYDGDLLDLSSGQHVIIRLFKEEPKYNWDIVKIVVLNY